MNDTPPTDGQGDDVEELYRRSSAQYPGRPSAKTRQAILERAAQIAANHSHTPRRRSILFGTLAAAVVAGLLVGPQFLRPIAPPRDVQTPAMQVSLSAPAAVPASPGPSASVASEAAAPGDRAAAPPQTSAGVAAFAARARQAPDARSADSSARAAAADASAPVDARDSEGRTALMLAVLQGRPDEVGALLREGADPNAADLAGVTPLQAARSQHEAEIAAALVEAGAR